MRSQTALSGIIDISKRFKKRGEYIARSFDWYLDAARKYAEHIAYCEIACWFQFAIGARIDETGVYLEKSPSCLDDNDILAWIAFSDAFTPEQYRTCDFDSGQLLERVGYFEEVTAKKLKWVVGYNEIVSSGALG
jgi:hypothetical protein